MKTWAIRTYGAHKKSSRKEILIVHFYIRKQIKDTQVNNLTSHIKKLVKWVTNETWSL